MAVKNLTDRFLASKHKVAVAAQEDYADEVGNGLYAVVQRTGTISFAIRYRRGGKLIKMTIGQYPAMTLKDARANALEAKATLNRHHDPRAIQQAARARASKEERPGDDTVAAWFDRYADDFEKRPKSRTISEVRRRGEIIKAAIGKTHIAFVTQAEIKKLINDIGATKPYHANRTFETCRAFYNWLISEGAVTANPCIGVKTFDERSRERVLDWDEFATVWRGVERLGYPFGPAIRLLMLTGQRRDEVGAMRWKEVNGRGEWTLPGDRTKNAKAHMVPLPDAAITVINTLPRVGELIFTTTHKNAISGWSKAKVRLDEMCPLTEPWRLHDLRRTFATGLAELGVAQQVTEELLNHASGINSGLTGVYNRYQYGTEKRSAMIAWSRFIDVITNDDLRTIYFQMKDHTAFRSAIQSDSVAWDHQLKRMRDAVPELLDPA